MNLKVTLPVDAVKFAGRIRRRTEHTEAFLRLDSSVLKYTFLDLPLRCAH